MLGHAEGLEASGYAPDVVTDGLVANLLIAQRRDGRWARGPALARPPLNDGDIGRTARAIAPLVAYGPPALAADVSERVGRARTWLVSAPPSTSDDHVMRLSGLVRATADRAVVRSAASALVALQRRDGGWGSTPNLPSDALSTAQALWALRASGRVQATDAVHRRAVRFLRATQLPDGSWHVRSRSVEVQPYFESGFPHGRDQWISAAATGWAATALAAELESMPRSDLPPSR